MPAPPPDTLPADFFDKQQSGEEEDAPRLSPYAKKGPYYTTLSPQQESGFQSWVKQNKVPFDSSPTSDYDMRGFYKGMLSGDPEAKTAQSQFDGKLHFSDKWKTPYHRTFSNESQYANTDAPKWIGDRLTDKNGNVISDETPKSSIPDTLPADFFSKQEAQQKQAKPTKSTGQGIGEFAGGLAGSMLSNLNPINAIKAFSHPMDFINADSEERKEFRKRGSAQLKKGDVAEGVSNYIEGAIPIAGPMTGRYFDAVHSEDYGKAGEELGNIVSLKAVPKIYSKIPVTAKTGGILARNAFENNRIVKAVKAAHAEASAVEPEVMAKPASPPASKPATAEPSTPPAAAPKKAPVNSRPKPTPGTTPTGEPIPGTDPFKNFKSPAREPTPSPPAAPPPQGRAPRPSDDFYKVHAQVKKAVNSANQLHAQGIKAADLMKLSDDELKQALGKHSRETYNRILFELRGLESGKVTPIN